MFRNLHVLLWFGLCAVMLVASCKKDDDQPSFTEEDLTIEGGWTFSARETNADEDVDAIVAGISQEQIDANGTNRTEVKQFLQFSAILIETVEPCEADESYVFETNGSITINEAVNCDDTEIINPQGSTWSLNGNSLTITTDGDATVWQILRLTENELVIETVTDDDDEILFGLTSTSPVRLKFFFAAN